MPTRTPRLTIPRQCGTHIAPLRTRYRYACVIPLPALWTCPTGFPRSPLVIRPGTARAPCTAISPPMRHNLHMVELPHGAYTLSRALDLGYAACQPWPLSTPTLTPSRLLYPWPTASNRTQKSPLPLAGLRACRERGQKESPLARACQARSGYFRRVSANHSRGTAPIMASKARELTMSVPPADHAGSHSAGVIPACPRAVAGAARRG